MPRKGKVIPGAKIAAIRKTLTDQKTLLKQIGILMVAESQDAFKAQRWDGTPWRPRGKVNTFGILADFGQGRSSPPSRRMDQRPALVDTGALRRSIAYRVVGRVVKVGTVLPYANVHQKGGKTKSVRVTKTIQERLAKWLKRQSKTIKGRLGWLLNRRYMGVQIEGKVPARPFVGITAATRRNVKKAIGVKIAKAR